MKKLTLIFLSTLFVVAKLAGQKSPVFEINGKAIRGYDVVAYYVKGEAVLGADNLNLKWNNSTWYFSTKANLELFKAAPEKYAPQYGGYCAYGTADGHKAPTQPDAWTIVNGKLYLNYNTKVKGLWIKDSEGYIKKADIKWPSLKDKE